MVVVMVVVMVVPPAGTSVHGHTRRIRGHRVPVSPPVVVVGVPPRGVAPPTPMPRRCRGRRRRARTHPCWP